MMNSRPRSLQDLVQKMMEVNTRLDPENNPSKEPEKLATETSSMEMGANRLRSEQPVTSKTLKLREEEPAKVHPLLEFNQDNLVRGIVFAEVLGKPKGRSTRMRS